MTTLLWRQPGSRRSEPELETPETPMWPELAELEVYTLERRLCGWIAPEGERTSDWMNRSADMELLAPVEIALDVERPALPTADASSSRLRLAASDVLFAVPPQLPPGRHLRLHRRVQRISFEMDGYDVSGRIHVRPGAEVGDYLLRSARVFVPITDAEVVHLVEPAFRRFAPTLIVNSRRVTRLHVIDHRTAAPEAATPRPPEPAAAAAGAEPISDVPPVAGAIHAALSELAALHRDGLVSDTEFAAKRAEILARL